MNPRSILGDHLNGQLGPDLVLEATQIGGQIFGVQHGFRSQIEVAADLISDRAIVAYVEIEPHARLLVRSSATIDIVAIPGRFDLHQLACRRCIKMRPIRERAPDKAAARPVLEWCMKIPFIAGEAGGQHCIDCTVRAFSICAALDKPELRELEHLSRHADFASGETVFEQEEIATSFYNVLKGVLRLYKLLPDGRRQIVGFALPGDFLGMAASTRHGYSADAIGPVTVC
jgi:hypothetical protein